MAAQSDDLTNCIQLADVADEITTRFFRSVELNVTTKPDRTPVSEADLAVDTALQKIVTNDFNDAYLSEEGNHSHVRGRQWIVDPIDGTKNFIRGMPIWATLISVQDESGTLAAMISAPALGRRWWAAKGQGAWTSDRDGTIHQIHVSKVALLGDAYLTYSTLSTWDDTPVGSQKVLNLFKQVWRERSPGDFFSFTMVAEGTADACIESSTKEWDMSAHAFIVQEAGGAVYTSASPDTNAKEPRMIVSSNGLLEADIRRALGI